ncbi:hypothetical protein HJFPF1_02729 [Paramyrothecium foliicola]|nr:hypothetical protein HJFPF1_02729 [Paramyrothecium foliicola]
MSQPPTRMAIAGPSITMVQFINQRLDEARAHFGLASTDSKGKGKSRNNQGLPDWIPLGDIDARKYPCETVVFDRIESKLAEKKAPSLLDMFLLTLLSVDGDLSPDLQPAPESARLRIQKLCISLQELVREQPGYVWQLRSSMWKTVVNRDATLWVDANRLPPPPKALSRRPWPQGINKPKEPEKLKKTWVWEDWMQFVDWRQCPDLEDYVLVK